MSAPLLLAIGLLGGAGAVARWLVAGAVAARAASAFPFGTLAVNLSGTLLLGVVVGAGVDDDPRRLAATGLLASYTTFSTWALETQRLADGGRSRAAALNVAVSLVLGLALIVLGRELGELLVA